MKTSFFSQKDINPFLIGNEKLSIVSNPLHICQCQIMTDGGDPLTGPSNMSQSLLALFF